MSTMLVKNIDLLLTMDEARREIRGGAVFVRDNVIEAVGTLRDMPAPENTTDVLDLSGRIVMPGMVNTHHHMFQTLTRVIAQDSELFEWLLQLYPLWARLRGQDITVSTQLAMAELLLSGCTTTSDHLYLFPNDVTLDHQIEGAEQMGMRFHAARGSMSLGESRGGLPPDSIVEDETDILRDTQRVIEQYHDASRHSMLRIVVAPCSPFSVTPDLMRESAELARSCGAYLHTHLAENERDIEYSREAFNRRPGEYAEAVGWLGGDVWHAHCVKLNEAELHQFAGTGTGVCHCPSSNMRLASGIAPVRRMIDLGVRVGLGVDGSASNDGGSMLSEARQAMLLQRVQGDPAGLRVREALDLATRGGASLLGRDDIGSIAPGMSADFVAFRTDVPGLAGAGHDPAAALLLCIPGPVDLSVINGRTVVRDGDILTVDLPLLVERHNELSRSLIEGR